MILHRKEMLHPSSVGKNLLLAACLSLPFSAVAEPLNCGVLKSQIEAKIRNNGVRDFTLTIVPVAGQASGKQVGTCNRGSEKIMYVRGAETARAGSPHTPPPPPSPPPDASQAAAIHAHVDFAIKDGGAPAGDCPKYGACCAVPNGIQPRSWIAAQAVIAAKNNRCNEAVTMLLATQCHNSDAATLLASHHDAVCDELRRH